MGYRDESETFRAQQAAEGPEVVDGQPALDHDGDGLYEDVNGDGDATTGDADVLFNAIFDEDPAVMNNPELFDFNQDGEVTTGDADVLFDLVFDGEVGPGTDGLDTGSGDGTTDSTTNADLSGSISYQSTTQDLTTHGATVTVANKGPTAADVSINYLIDGGSVFNEIVALKPGESRDVNIDIGVNLTEGSHTATLMGKLTSANDSVELDTATFDAQEFAVEPSFGSGSVSPQSMSPETTAEITGTVNVTNVGQAAGAIEVTFIVDTVTGGTVSSDGVIIGSGSTTNLQPGDSGEASASGTYTPAEPGTLYVKARAGEQTVEIGTIEVASAESVTANDLSLELVPSGQKTEYGSEEQVELIGFVTNPTGADFNGTAYVNYGAALSSFGGGEQSITVPANSESEVSFVGVPDATGDTEFELTVTGPSSSDTPTTKQTTVTLTFPTDTDGTDGTDGSQFSEADLVIEQCGATGQDATATVRNDNATAANVTLVVTVAGQWTVARETIQVPGGSQQSVQMPMDLSSVQAGTWDFAIDFETIAEA